MPKHFPYFCSVVVDIQALQQYYRSRLIKIKRHIFENYFVSILLAKLNVMKIPVELRDGEIKQIYDGPNGSLFISILFHNSEF